MSEGVNDRQRALDALDDAVDDAIAYLTEVDPDLDGGHQTAREVLCHFVFWHREYVAITRAMLTNRQLPLRCATYAKLNAEATKEFSEQSMTDLATSLSALQRTLSAQLLALPDWSVDFPAKEGARFKSVAERIANIEGHLRGHIKRLRRAERLGEAWVKAYYPNQE